MLSPASPTDPPGLTVNDPFEAHRTTALTTPRALADNQATPLRLHRGETYLFKCTAVNARPAAMLTYSLNPSIASIVFNPPATVADPTGSTTDTSRSLMYMVRI